MTYTLVTFILFLGVLVLFSFMLYMTLFYGPCGGRRHELPYWSDEPTSDEARPRFVSYARWVTCARCHKIVEQHAPNCHCRLCMS
jgi:hypothetical protein